MNVMHCSASRAAPYQAKQEVHDAEADQEASLNPLVATVIFGRMWDKF